jgi:putative endonuclease
MRRYHVYIMASLSRTIYVGVTNSLAQRVFQHRMKMVPGFTSKYNITRLVYAEACDDVRDAIAREKQLKGWRRERKMTLIESVNPEWDDLAETWFAAEQDSSLCSE